MRVLVRHTRLRSGAGGSRCSLRKRDRDHKSSSHQDLIRASGKRGNGVECYLEDPELLNRLAGEKLGGAKARLEAEGWGWVEVADDRDYSFLGKHGRLRATPTEVPTELLAERGQLRAELETMRDTD